MILGAGRGEKLAYKAPSDHVATTVLYDLVSVRAAEHSNTLL